MSFTLDRLKESFSKATSDCFWHYVMKNCPKESTFRPELIEARIKAIETETKKPNSFEHRSVHGWTPLHVAAISGNVVGMRFLLGRGVNPSVPDAAGRTPSDYCAMLHPDLQSILQPSSSSSSSSSSSGSQLVKGIVLKALEPFRVALPQKPFLYREHSDDFGVGLKTLLFSPPTTPEQLSAYKDMAGKIEHFVENIKQIAEDEGFVLELATHQFAVRDNILQLPNGTCLVPEHSTNTLRAIEKSNSLSFVFNNSSSSRTDHSIFEGSVGGSLGGNEKAKVELKKRCGEARQSRFFAEGGDLYRSTNASGRSKLLVGAYLFPIILNQWRMDKVFEDPGIRVDLVAQSLAHLLTPELISRCVSEMYAQGLLAKGKNCEKGFISREEMSDLIKERLSRVYGTSSSSDSHKSCSLFDLSIELGVYKPLKLTPDQIESCRSMALRYFAQQKIVIELLARSFSLSEEDVHCIPQAGYHLDTFMKPGPMGSYFVQDYECCAQLLKGIQGNTEILGLSEMDRELLERYIATAQKLEKEIGPILQDAKTELIRAGFHVIPTPGVFFDICPRTVNYLDPNSVKTYNVNFINAITGWSEKNGRYFYIASGAEAGDRLGSILMQAFNEFLSTYQEGIKVHYIGHDPANPTCFAEAMAWWNRNFLLAGPHCLSREWETVSHRG